MSPEEPSVQDNYLSSQLTTQHYSTRKKTVDLAQFGLKKRTQTEISVGAQWKRAEKDAAKTEKLEASSAKIQRQKTGIERLKKLEAEKLREYTEDEWFSHGQDTATYEDAGPHESDPLSDSEESQPEGSQGGKDDDDEQSQSQQGSKGKQREKAKPLQLTAAEKRRVRAQELRESIAANNSRTPTPQLRRESSTKMKAKMMTGLLPDWHAKLQAGGPATNKLPAPQVNVPTSQGLIPTWKSRLQDPSTPFPTGFNGRTVNSKPRALQCSRAAKDSDNDVISRKGVVANPALTRQKQSVVDPDKSISTDVLPAWIKPFFWSEVMPTLRDIYGGLSDPWDLNQADSDFFLHALQRATDAACPDQHYEATKGDPVYRVAHQQMYEWQRDFMKATLKAVQEGVLEQCGKEASPGDIKQYVTATFAPDGEAYNGTPEGKIFAQAHLAGIQGSCCKDTVYPVGALALSMAAVQLSFCTFAQGKFVPGPGFSKVTAGILTLGYTSGSSFSQLLVKKSRFDGVVEAALAYVHVLKVHKKGNGLGLQPVQLMVYSSPPGSPTAK
ncbi:hypothetical protein PAXINDRAFT_156984 [Paxillus involutus ATCC 200175]|uniref:Uncharacterized protein n=1 Tax=Paxillus involutus ATCC 200175 TaxID=664439 RepID=A0A0C9TXC8_PAXIN|nr:hypothetical protein PAXINDRAFT_156984 [Paxillus involutus ATCC 200175]